jgi:hypothetical protein
MSQPTSSSNPSSIPAAISNPVNPRHSILPIIVCALLIAGFAATAWLASLHESATTDEPVSLFSAWASTHLQDFRCDPENPPLWKYYVGLSTTKNDFASHIDSSQWNQLLQDSKVEGPLASESLYATPGLDAGTLLRRARSRMILLGAILAATIAWWAWRIAGSVAAIVATAFFCLDPNFLAHTPLIKNDVPITLAFVCLMAIAWLVGERATFPRISSLAIALAATILTKFSGLLAIPILALLLLFRSMLPTPWPVGPWIARTRMSRLLASAVILFCSLMFTWGATWASYDFRYAPTNNPAASFDFDHELQICAAHECLAQSDDPFNVSPQQMQTFVQNWTPPTSLRLVLAANAHHLLPQSFISGLIGLFAWSRGRVAFLCGQSSVVGWWYYFPLAMVFKTPLATLIAFAVALALLAKNIRRLNPATLWTLAVASFPPLLYLAYAMSSRVDVGIRHIFPIYPFLFILIGIAASYAYNRHAKSAAIIATVLILALAAETASAFPNFIPFFNLAAGDARNGIHLLGDSNIDWGQDLPDLAQWQRQNPNHQLYLCYWGSADPRYYGVHYINLVASDAPPDQIAPTPKPPAYVFSAAALTQPSFCKLYGPLLNTLEKHPPATILDGSLYIYTETK